MPTGVDIGYLWQLFFRVWVDCNMCHTAMSIMKTAFFFLHTFLCVFTKYRMWVKNVMSFVDVVWLGKNKGHMDEARKPYLWSLISGISRRSCYHGSRSHIVVMYVIIILHEKFIPVLKMTNRLWLQICSINITRLITIPVLLKIITVVGM